MINQYKAGLVAVLFQVGAAHAGDSLDACDTLLREANEIEYLLLNSAMSYGDVPRPILEALEYIDPETTGPKLAENQVDELQTELGALAEKMAISMCDYSGGSGGGSGSGSSTPSSTRTVRVTCESWDYDAETCKLPRNIYNVTLVQRLSNTSCAGRYYASGDTLHVTNGCRGVFSAFLSSPVTVNNFTCESWGYSYASCGFPVAGPQTVWLHQRNSNSRCEQGTTWGLSGVPPMWVNHGCRGVFSSAQ